MRTPAARIRHMLLLGRSRRNIIGPKSFGCTARAAASSIVKRAAAPDIPVEALVLRASEGVSGGSRPSSIPFALQPKIKRPAGHEDVKTYGRDVQSVPYHMRLTAGNIRRVTF